MGKSRNGTFGSSHRRSISELSQRNLTKLATEFVFAESSALYGEWLTPRSLIGSTNEMRCVRVAFEFALLHRLCSQVDLLHGTSA